MKGMLTDRDIADRRLVGIVSQADVAISNSPDQVGKLVEAISTG